MERKERELLKRDERVKMASEEEMRTLTVCPIAEKILVFADSAEDERKVNPLKSMVELLFDKVFPELLLMYSGFWRVITIVVLSMVLLISRDIFMTAFSFTQLEEYLKWSL